jgi:Ser/Thr protein kinase RdoA (MazF antagonist)
MAMAAGAAENFSSRDQSVAAVEKCGHGIIHDTYLVTLNSGASRFILQRINTQVFTNPEAIMRNLHLVCDHIQKRMKVAASRIGAEWQMLRSLPARDGSDFFIDADGVFWRALRFIQGAVPLERISSPDEAREVGRALGTFHWLVSDLNPELLQDTLPGFHNVEQYLGKYDAVAGQGKEISGLEKYCRQFVEDRRGWAPVLENGRRENLLRVRVIHGDPKINNIMVNIVTGKAVSIIDLDTVMPGLVQYDIGDCLRSCCNTMGENAADLSAVRFDLERCKAVLAGYAGAGRGFLTGNDVSFLFAAIKLIPFELGLRFYTDFLEGNVYFKASSRDQNLDRALVQFKLVESIEEQEDELRAIIQECYADFMDSDSR